MGAGGLASKGAWGQEGLPAVPFYLRSSCPGLPGRQKRPQSYIHLLLGLHPPLPMAIPPRTSSMPLQGQSPSPECKPQLTQVTQHHPGMLPPVPFGESQPGGEGLWQAAPRSPAPQSPRLPLGAQVRSPWPGRGPCPAASRGWRGRQVPAAPPVPFSTAPCLPRSPSGGTARLKYQSRPSRGAQELTSAAPGF